MYPENVENSKLLKLTLTFHKNIVDICIIITLVVFFYTYLALLLNCFFMLYDVIHYYYSIVRTLSSIQH